MLRIPTRELPLWIKEHVDECMASASERGQVYGRASQYYYTGTQDSRAAIYNKCKPFIEKLSGFLMQPTDVRFQIGFDSGESDDVLDRAQLVGEKLTTDFRNTDCDVKFSEAVTWSLINGCQLLKLRPDGPSFNMAPVHPQNFGVLNETTVSLEEQEAFCHVSYPTISRLRAWLREIDHPKRADILARIVTESTGDERDAEPMTYWHQMVVGGLNPAGNINEQPSAAGIVNVFPTPMPYRPNKKFAPTVKFCELWVKDLERDGDYTTVQCVYGAEPIIIEGSDTRRNLSRVPGHSSFVKVQGQPTPGYFWGRSIIADVQMLQEVLNKRLRDIKVMWDRNVGAPQVLSGFTSVTEEAYFKILNEGGFLSDPNPNAKATKLTEPPPENYMEELQFLMGLFDEASGFTPVMSGQGESGVRAGTHAQTLVRTSSPRLIDQASRIERTLADCGYLGLSIMQAMDASIYTTDKGKEFLLSQLPENFNVSVDSHSASPAFAEDNRQVAIALARAGAIDAEDLIHLTHPPGSEMLLARLRQRKKEQAQAAQQEEQQDLLRDVLRLPQRKQGGGGGRKPK
ncbi:MAG TPA: hypothetical protein VHT52_22095 [Stellaceae bacterium]|jgi:hypothetical protein|nr:hypothetical protein [Stellaceae bacterium]